MLKKEFYLVKRSYKEIKGYPTFFNYEFVKDTCGSIVDSREGDYFYYNQCESEELVFNCKHRMINFDFLDIHSREYFVSHKFLQLLNIDDTNYKIKKALFVSTKGERITEKKYYILRIVKELEAVDIDRSIIEVSKEFDFIKETKYLELDESIIGNRDLFCINNDTFAGMLFCSDVFKLKAEAARINVTFIPIKDAAKEEEKE